MSGWLERRRHREAAKLLCQNELALSYLRGYFQNDHTVLAWINGALKRNRELERATFEGWGSLSTDKLGWLLQANKEARRPYSTTVGSSVEGFDRAHTPMEGWRVYFKNLEDGR